MMCRHCPLDPSLICRGEEHKHFCKLVDPNDPSYKPEYIRILEQDDHIHPNGLPTDTVSVIVQDGYSPCCGGAPLPS